MPLQLLVLVQLVVRRLANVQDSGALYFVFWFLSFICGGIIYESLLVSHFLTNNQRNSVYIY